MTWQKAIGQEKVKEIFQRAITENRIAHAYCLWGNEGTGKEAISIEFAKTVNCLNPIIIDKSIEYCGHCSSCNSSDHLQHPNISLVFAVPTGKGTDSKSDSSTMKLDDSQIDEISKQIRYKSEDYYHKIAVTGGNQIRINSVREIKRNLSMSASVNGRRVIIVCRADEMTSESANAFLKTLEEPQEKITIILTTSRKEMILPTILSRCQLIHCPPLGEDDLKNYLMNYKGFAEIDASMSAAFAQGSINRALGFLDDGTKQLRESAVQILRTSLKRKNYRLELTQGIDELVKAKDKRKIENFLNLIILWLRDVWTIVKTESDGNLINIDQRDILIKFAENFGDKDIPAAIVMIETAIQQLKQNVQPGMLMLNLFNEMRKLFYRE